MDDEPLRDFADRFFRDALRSPDNLCDFLMDAVPTLAPHFDFARTALLETQFKLPDWTQREADLLFEIPYRFDAGERIALVCVLIEHQTRPDPRMPLRMLLETALYWERQWRAWEDAASPKDEFRLTPVLPLVLHTGARPWGSVRTVVEMLGPPAAFHSFTPAWSPVFWELSAHSPEHLLNADAAFLQVLTVVRAEAEDIAAFGRYFQEALRRLESMRGSNRVRWVEMVQLIFGWVFHRRPREEREMWTNLGAATQEDDYRKEEFKAMAQTIGKTLIEEAHEDRARHMLLLQGRKRFGEPPPEVFLALQEIEDLDRFDRMTLRMLEVSTWTELLETM